MTAIAVLLGCSLGLGGRMAAAGDQDRARVIQKKLHDEPELADNDVKVDVAAHRVRLTGTVDSIDERLKAEEVVLRSDSSVTVENQLRVAGDRKPKAPADRTAEKVRQQGSKVAHQAAKAATEVGDMANDAWITSKIKTQLIGADGVHASGINVDTADGVVTLRGNVRSEAEHQKALSIARSSRGVVKVVDQLAVVPH
jgi:osmotically-inducible protein OsmY